MEQEDKVLFMSDMAADGKEPEILFWVGCAGSYDARAQKITKALVKILNHASVSFAILGKEENCTGDPARRAGNEFIFQMLALQNIETFKMYNVKRIVTFCPHCFNTLKNEYPELGSTVDVIHHTQFIKELIESGRLKVASTPGQVTYHDSCYLGRINDVYDVPRDLITAMGKTIEEMPRNRTRGLCCGAGGAQMFKEDEPGDKRINIERIEEALDTGAETILVNCPFCTTMIEDGLKSKEKQESVMVYDLSEMIVQNNGWN